MHTKHFYTDKIWTIFLCTKRELIMWELIRVGIDSCENWLVWGLIHVGIDSCENWFLWEMIMWEFIRVGIDSCGNWFVWELIRVGIDSCGNWFMWELWVVSIRWIEKYLGLALKLPIFRFENFVLNNNSKDTLTELHSASLPNYSN